MCEVRDLVVGVVRLRACLKTGEPIRPRTLRDTLSRQRLRKPVWFPRCRQRQHQSSGDTLGVGFSLRVGVSTASACVQRRLGRREDQSTPGVGLALD